MDGLALNAIETRELAEGIFAIGAFKMGDFLLKSGEQSPFYIDLRRISSSPRLLTLSGRAYAALLSDLSYEHIAGIPIAAMPLATATALTSQDSLIYPRIEKKRHGSGIQVEGVWQSGERAVLLDDVITDGGSKLEAAFRLREAGIKVEYLVVLIERGHRGRAEMEKSGIQMRSWKTVEDIILIGFNANFIEKTMMERALGYLECR